MFVDHIKVHARAGKGGRGSVSFLREKFVPEGGPNGGDGGRGGDIIFRPDPNVDNLVNFYYQSNLRAKNGEHGQGKNCYARPPKTKSTMSPSAHSFIGCLTKSPKL